MALKQKCVQCGKPAKLLKSKHSAMHCSIVCWKKTQLYGIPWMYKGAKQAFVVESDEPETGLTLEQLQANCPIEHAGFDAPYTAPEIPEPMPAKPVQRNRNNALLSGELVSTKWMNEIAKEAKIPFPTAITSAAFDLYVKYNQAVVANGEDEQIRWRQVLVMFRKELERHPSAERAKLTHLPFEFAAISRMKHHTNAELVAVMELDENSQPCLTFQLPSE